MLKGGWTTGVPAASATVIAILLGCVALAGVLGAHAFAAARQSRIATKAILQQYAQLAGWELARQTRRDVQQTVMRSLNAYAHPVHTSHRDSCNCHSLGPIDSWLEVTVDGTIRRAEGASTEAVEHVRSMIGPDDGSGEGAVRIASITRQPTRFAAVRYEPHLADGEAFLGLVADKAAAVPVVRETLRTAALLPAALMQGLSAASVVHIAIVDSSQQLLLVSSGTAEGPEVVTVPLLAEFGFGWAARVSVSREAVPRLAPGHSYVPSTNVIVALVLINTLLVGVGIWQVTRERELARLRASFVAGVSHELRTPLAQIRMFSEMLQLGRVRNDVERDRAVDIIGREATRLGHLVDNVIQLHRHDRAGLPDGEPVDLGALSADVVSAFEPLARAKGVTLRIEGSDAAGARVRGDSDQLRQVLLNLLDNAVKFGPAAQTVLVSLTVHASDVTLAVDDAGPGVPASERTRIFQPFVRGRQTHGAGGAGIGLALVQQIVTRHQGTVSVSGAPSGGARFSITLPKAN